MHTQLAPVAAVNPTAATPRPIHVVCCDPNEALCGTAVTRDIPDDADVTCRLCSIAYEEDLPCANPSCPD